MDRSLESANDFMRAFQEITTEWCWGYAWTRPRPGLENSQHADLAMLTALNRAPELKLHVRGALTTGVTEEIKEILLHATVYCGSQEEGLMTPHRQSYQFSAEAVPSPGEVRQHRCSMLFVMMSPVSRSRGPAGSQRRLIRVTPWIERIQGFTPRCAAIPSAAQLISQLYSKISLIRM